MRLVPLVLNNSRKIQFLLPINLRFVILPNIHQSLCRFHCFQLNLVVRPTPHLHGSYGGIMDTTLYGEYYRFTACYIS